MELLSLFSRWSSLIEYLIPFWHIIGYRSSSTSTSDSQSDFFALTAACIWTYSFLLATFDAFILSLIHPFQAEYGAKFKKVTQWVSPFSSLWSCDWICILRSELFLSLFRVSGRRFIRSVEEKQLHSVFKKIQHSRVFLSIWEFQRFSFPSCILSEVCFN